jgi:integrase
MADELAQVRQAIESERRPVGRYKGPDFWLALFLVCWDTGERITPILALDWNAVDLRHRWIRFDASTRKGGRADNMLPIATDTAAALKKLRPFDGRVFKWPYAPTYIYHRLGKIMERAGLPNDRLHKFHCFRKSTASHYEAAGGNATELLKHSSRRVTKAYLDPRIVRPTPAVELLFRPGAANTDPNRA